jgi:hypothetical protein
VRFVASPVQTPQRCAFLPTIQGFHPKGFIEGTELWGGDRAYLSMEAFEQIATAAGWAPKQVSAKDARRVKELEAELESARARIALLEGEQAAVATLRRMGYKPAAKPGRPPKQKQEVA